MKFLVKLILVFTLFIKINFYSQHLNVEYEKYSLKEIDYTTQSKEYQDKVNRERKKAQKFFLYYADGYSFFKSIPRNSIVNNAGDKQESNIQTHKREVYKEIELKLYHNKNDNGTYGYHYFKDINEEFYGYKDSKFSKIEYKDETIAIDNYLCKLVEVSLDSDPKIYKIWYTEDLPISAGPFLFNTFPGLVLRVECPDYKITAIKISNETKEQDVEKLNPELKIYKNKDYDKKMQEIKELQSKSTFEEIKL